MLQQHDITDRLWAKIGIGLYQSHNHVLHVICDDYSNFIEVESIANITTGRVIKALETQFTRYSVPDTVVFDGEPHFPHRNLPYS